MRYIARHYVRVGQARYTPGEMLNLEDRETALSMIRRGALEETVENGEETAAEEAPEEAEETEEDETQERQTNGREADPNRRDDHGQQKLRHAPDRTGKGRARDRTHPQERRQSG